MPLDVGRKVKTTSEYARLLRAGQGTVQKAFKRLEEMQAMVLESRGHLGTYLAAKDLGRDRKSTRLNSSHANISYAVFCLKKKTKPLSRISVRTCTPIS